MPFDLLFSIVYLQWLGNTEILMAGSTHSDASAKARVA